MQYCHNTVASMCRVALYTLQLDPKDYNHQIYEIAEGTAGWRGDKIENLIAAWARNLKDKNHE